MLLTLNQRRTEERDSGRNACCFAEPVSRGLIAYNLSNHLETKDFWVQFTRAKTTTLVVQRQAYFADTTMAQAFARDFKASRFSSGFTQPSFLPIALLRLELWSLCHGTYLPAGRNASNMHKSSKLSTYGVRLIAKWKSWQPAESCLEQRRQQRRLLVKINCLMGEEIKVVPPINLLHSPNLPLSPTIFQILNVHCQVLRKSPSRKVRGIARILQA